MNVLTHSSDALLVFVTTATEAEARSIAGALVADRLAACVSISSIESVYRWQEQVQQDHEWQLMIKTHADQMEAIATRIQELHSYDVPELIAVPIVQGSAAYLGWLQQQVS